MAQDIILILRGLGIVSKHALNNLDINKSAKGALSLLEATKPAKYTLEKIATKVLNNPKLTASDLAERANVVAEGMKQYIVHKDDFDRNWPLEAPPPGDPHLQHSEEKPKGSPSSGSHIEGEIRYFDKGDPLPKLEALEKEEPKEWIKTPNTESLHFQSENATLSSPKPPSTSHLPSNKEELASLSSFAHQEQNKPSIDIPSHTEKGFLNQEISPAASTTEPLSSAAPSKQVESSAEIKIDQALSQRARERRVPASRVSRFLTFGGLAVGVGMGALNEGVQRSLGLKDPSAGTKSLFLNEANAARIVNTLCHVRGAALKLGQMISIQDNNLVSPQLQAVFERVRQSADFMPTWQMERVMQRELGDNWKDKFAKFESKPFAAASIGQVHYGQLLDGRDVAIKIQYPGVAEGIDSDISNLTTLLKTWNILPRGFYIENVIASAKRELSWEVDYLREAECGIRFKKLVEPFHQYYVPEVISDLTTKRVLTTELIHGIPVDKMVDSPQETRNLISRHLLELTLRELFQFKFMQTDPNWSNFFYNPKTQQISLLDFGACRSYGDEFVDNYIKVIKAAALQKRDKVLFYLQKLGFLTGYENKAMEKAHSEAVLILGEALAFKDAYDFGSQDVTRRIMTILPVMVHNRLTPPPEESYSLHRKLSGMFLLCTKLKAKINCSSLFDPIYENYIFTTTTPEL